MADQRISLHEGIDLVRAIDDSRLFLDYQPVVDLRDESIVRFEALVRRHTLAIVTIMFPSSSEPLRRRRSCPPGAPDR